MAKVKGTNPPSERRKGRPALSPEARENQLISLAIDLVEQRLIDGTASSQETTHFLKLGSTKARLEKELLEKQAKLAEAKVEAIHADKEKTELFKAAIEAMKRYTGHGDDDD